MLPISKDPESPMNILYLFPTPQRLKRMNDTSIPSMVKASISFVCWLKIKNSMMKDMVIIMLMPDDNPSIPSMKFMEFIMNIKNNIVSGMPMYIGISYIPNTPHILCIHVPEAISKKVAII